MQGDGSKGRRAPARSGTFDIGVRAGTPPGFILKSRSPLRVAAFFMGSPHEKGDISLAPAGVVQHDVSEKEECS